MKPRHKLDLLVAELCLKAGPVLGVDAADLHDQYFEYLQQTLAEERAAAVRDAIANDEATSGIVVQARMTTVDSLSFTADEQARIDATVRAAIGRRERKP